MVKTFILIYFRNTKELNDGNLLSGYFILRRGKVRGYKEIKKSWATLQN